MHSLAPDSQCFVVVPELNLSSHASMWQFVGLLSYATSIYKFPSNSPDHVACCFRCPRLALPSRTVQAGRRSAPRRGRQRTTCHGCTAQGLQKRHIGTKTALGSEVQHPPPQPQNVHCKLPYRQLYQVVFMDEAPGRLRLLRIGA